MERTVSPLALAALLAGRRSVPLASASTSRRASSRAVLERDGGPSSDGDPDRVVTLEAAIDREGLHARRGHAHDQPRLGVVADIVALPRRRQSQGLEAGIGQAHGSLVDGCARTPLPGSCAAQEAYRAHLPVRTFGSGVTAGATVQPKVNV